MEQLCPFAIDIGGTLIKLVSIISNDNENLIPGDSSLDLDVIDSRFQKGQFQSLENIRLRFHYIQRDDLKNLLSLFKGTIKNGQQQADYHKVYNDDFINMYATSLLSSNKNHSLENQLIRPGSYLPVTGGGAFKFFNLVETTLKVRVIKQDEMHSAMSGLSFLSQQKFEVFSHDLSTKIRTQKDLSEPIFPFLLVNIGSGVSILKAEGGGKFSRVTGSCIGGGTMMGLGRLLTGVTSFEEVVDLAEKGSDCLDLKVGDLFGDAAGSLCFPPDTLASSFGKLYVNEKDFRGVHGIRREDVARSLVNMVSYNLGYLAYLSGIIHNIRRIFFAGKYINHHLVTMDAVTSAVEFYTRQYSHCHNRLGTKRLMAVNTKEHGTHEDQTEDDLFLIRSHKGGEEKTEEQPMNRFKSEDVKLSDLGHLDEGSLSRRHSQKNESWNKSCEVNQWNDASEANSRHEPFSHETSTMVPKTANDGFDFAKQRSITSKDDPTCSLSRKESFNSTTTTPKLNDHFSRINHFFRDPTSSQFEVLSLKHDGYLGALGALLLAIDNIKE